MGWAARKSGAWEGRERARDAPRGCRRLRDGACKKSNALARFADVRHPHGLGDRFGGRHGLIKTAFLPPIVIDLITPAPNVAAVEAPPCALAHGVAPAHPPLNLNMLRDISMPSGLLHASQTVIVAEKDVELHASLSASASALPAAAAAAPAPAPAASAPSAADAAPSAEEPYYWEAPAGAPSPALPVVLIHNVHYAFSRALSTAEYVGDFFAEFFGLYNSRYEWAADLERRQLAAAEEAEHLEERRQRWEEAKRLNGGRPVVGVPVAAAAAAPPPPQGQQPAGASSFSKEDGGSVV